MTKKHFEALAAALNETRPDITDKSVVWAKWEVDVSAVASVCARFNPNFDRARFLKACGVEG